MQMNLLHFKWLHFQFIIFTNVLTCLYIFQIFVRFKVRDSSLDWIRMVHKHTDIIIFTPVLLCFVFLFYKIHHTHTGFCIVVHKISKIHTTVHTASQQNPPVLRWAWSTTTYTSGSYFLHFIHIPHMILFIVKCIAKGVQQHDSSKLWLDLRLMI